MHSPRMSCRGRARQMSWKKEKGRKKKRMRNPFEKFKQQTVSQSRMSHLIPWFIIILVMYVFWHSSRVVGVNSSQDQMESLPQSLLHGFKHGKRTIHLLKIPVIVTAQCHVFGNFSWSSATTTPKESSLESDSLLWFCHYIPSSQ